MPKYVYKVAIDDATDKTKPTITITDETGKGNEENPAS